MIPKLGGEKKIVLSNFALYANMPLDELCKKFAAWSGKKRIARTGHDGQQKAVKAAAEAHRIKATEGRAKDVRRLFDAAMSLAPDWCPTSAPVRQIRRIEEGRSRRFRR
jgi:hypothetical protein